MTREEIYWAILLNLVASAIFLLIFQPAVGWFRNAILNIISLGSHRLKDIFYQRVATGFHSSDMQVLATLGFFLALHFLSEMQFGSPIVLIFVVAFLPLALFFIVARESSVHAAILHYRQLVAMIRTFVEPAQIAIFDSRFAQIATDTDYKTLILELKSIAAAHNLRVPAFNPW